MQQVRYRLGCASYDHSECPYPINHFRNFLYDRQQRVVVNNKSSSFFTCNKGVPQGSVLGPLLFNIYVADLPSLAREHGAKMPSFADDMTLYCSHTSAALACSTVSAALKDTSRALALRGLSIHPIRQIFLGSIPNIEDGVYRLHTRAMGLWGYEILSFLAKNRQ